MHGSVQGREVIGADHPVAIVLQTFGTVIAAPAAVDNATDAHQFSHPETRHMFAHRRDAANDFMSRHAGIKRARPFRANLVDVGMTYAATGDVDLRIMHAHRTPDDVHKFERLVARVSAVSFAGNGLDY